jgi:hypothetical protein
MYEIMQSISIILKKKSINYKYMSIISLIVCYKQRIVRYFDLFQVRGRQMLLL